MAIVIIGILAIFTAGMTSKNEPPLKQTANTPAQTASTPSSAPTPADTQNQAPAATGSLDPALATDFLKLWMASAFDYSQTTANQSHERAFSWMTPEAQQTFRTSFWTPEVAGGIGNGTLSASFKPGNIQAEAINPDGSVVIGVNGIISLNNGGQEHVQELQTDFLVRRVEDGLRVAGIYSRAVATPGSSVY